MNADFKKASMQDVDDRFPRGRNSSNGISGPPVRTEAESLNEQKSNLGTNEDHNDKNETQNCRSWLQAPSTSEALCPEKLARIYGAILRMTNIIEDEHSFTMDLLEKFKLEEIKYIKTDEEFALKFAEYERVRALSRLLIKIIQRCRKLQKYHLAYILKGVLYYSSKMNLKILADVKKYMIQNFYSLRIILNLISSVYKMDEILNTYSIALAEAQSEYRILIKGKQCKSDLSPESTHDLITPIDHDIAIILKDLLNLSKDMLLPILREIGVIPTNNDLVISCTCKDSPDSLREHMVLLEAILSDSKDLWTYTEEPVGNLDYFFSAIEELIKISTFEHNNLTNKYLNSSINVRNINIISLTVTREKYKNLLSHYCRTRNQHNEVKKCILKSRESDQKNLEIVLSSLFQFDDATHMTKTFIAILNVFAWLTTVSEKYAEFIELDQIFLTNYTRIMNKLRIID